MLTSACNEPGDSRNLRYLRSGVFPQIEESTREHRDDVRRIRGHPGRRAARPTRGVHSRRSDHRRLAPGGREIGRASCRERVWQYVEISVVAVALKKK